MLALIKSRVVYDRIPINTAEELRDNITDVRMFNDELDLFYPSGKPGMVKRLCFVKAADVNFVGETYDDALTHFQENYKKYWEVINA